MANMIDETEIRKAIAILKPDGELFEIRILGENKKTWSGYFRDADTLITNLKRMNLKNTNVYITLNPPMDACYAREQRDCFVQNPKATTSDNDVSGLEWLMVDLDPKRPSGTSSSDEELQLAKNLGNKIFTFMGGLGFEKPLMAISGNGVHLLYRVKLANTAENIEVLKKSLSALNLLFSTRLIGVDIKNFNPSRICKLYGTLAQKGIETDDRKHRMSQIVGNQTEIKATDIAYLKKLCSKLPQEQDTPRRYNNYNPREFDLDEWLDKYGLRYQKVDVSDATKYILECCPFDSNHKGKDAVIFRSRSGAIGFNCFHNSCAGKTWQDVRMLYEPDAYEKNREQEKKQAYGSFNRNYPKEPPKIIEKENVPVFISAKDVITMPHPPEAFIKTGVNILDQRLRGLKKTFTSLWSGLRGSAKSTLLSEICLNAVDDGNNVLLFSGEMSNLSVTRWMMLQAAGKNRVDRGMYEGYYTVPKAISMKIADWLEGKFLLYNNDYGNNYVAFKEKLEEQIEKQKTDLVVLDNLMAFDIKNLSEAKWDAQTEFVLSLTRIAKKHNVHVAFVAHPRKSMGFLRLTDVSGSADLSNAVDDAFIVHRNNEDFKRMFSEMYDKKIAERVINSGTNIVEIAKDRDNGTQDVFIPLFYEVETKRLKNEKAENRIYGWDNKGFEKVSMEDIPY